MALEFLLWKSCDLQENSHPLDFMKKRKIRNMIEWALSRRQWLSHYAKGGDFEEQLIRIPYPVKIEGREKSDVSLRELRALWQDIEDQAALVCPQCPANLAQCTMGCYGAVRYPLGHALEQWLIKRFNPPEGEEGYMPHYIRENSISGDQIDFLSQAGSNQVFDSDRAVSRSLFPGGRPYSSRQVLEFILGCQPLFSPLALFEICIDFEILQGPLKDQNIIRASLCREEIDRGQTPFPGRNALLQGFKIDLKLRPDEDRGIMDFKQFFLAACQALLQEIPLYIQG